MCIGSNIRKRRRELNISGEKLGNAIGVTKAMISRYETGLNTPTMSKMETIAKFLKTTIDGLSKPIFIGENISKRRAELKITGKSLADAVGVSTTMISMYENGANVPTSCKMKAIARFLDTTVEKLYKQNEG